MIDTFVNDRTLHVCAIRRSGHHAVIQWIVANSGVASYFLNDCEPRRNPYVGQRVLNNRFPAGFDIDAERTGRWSHKPLLVCAYEDQDLPNVYPPWFAPAMEQWIGPSVDTTHVLVLRDPFNLFASKYRWALGTKWKPSLEELTTLPELWKAYAYEFLDRTSHVPRPMVAISYNQWFADAEYRRTLALTLGLGTTDKGRDRIARWGPNTWGDSFDNLTYDGRASEMKVLDRWQLVADQPFYRSLVSDPELMELSTAIFGSIPGTEQFAR